MADDWANAYGNKPTPANATPVNSGYKPRNGTARKATNYNSAKYQQNIKQFPDDLFDNKSQYGGNWVAFYINVSSGSKLLKNKLVTLTNNDYASIRNNLDPTGTTTISMQAAAGATGAGAALAGGVASLLNNGNALDAAATALKAGAVAWGLSEAVALSTMNQENQLKRITDTIVLTVPNNLQSRYTMQYADESTAQQANMIGVGGDAVDAIKKAWKAASSGEMPTAAGAKDAASTVGNLVKSVSSAVLAPIALATGGAGGDFMSKIGGVATNPKKEQIFRGVDFRTFSFDYTFAPRSLNESKQVADIIQLFKLHMHPEFNDKDGYLFIYPSEFDIYYYHGNEENMNLPRHTSCVLTDCNVSYAPNNQFTTFAAKDNDPGGASTQIMLSLTFKELAILTKDQIMDGF